MDWLLIGIVITAFVMLGVTRHATGIRIVALQGALLSLLPIVADWSFDIQSLTIFCTTFAIKAIVIPILLFRSLREATVQKEIRPTVSLNVSLLIGGAIALLAFSSLKVLPGPTAIFSPLIIPSALAVVLIGFFLLVSRSGAMTQVIGFLVLENGIFLIGMMLVVDFPMMVEMGVLLDMLVGVFVMGIMIYKINRTFDHIDTRSLARLKDTQ